MSDKDQVVVTACVDTLKVLERGIAATKAVEEIRELPRAANGIGADVVRRDDILRILEEYGL